MALDNFFLLSRHRELRFLVDISGNQQLLIDVIPTRSKALFFPVEIKSTAYLQYVNLLSSEGLQLCLHSEMWPISPRIKTLCLFGEMGESSIEDVLIRHLTISVDEWGRDGDHQNMLISDRAAEYLVSSKGRNLLEKFEITHLSEEYKECKVSL